MARNQTVFSELTVGLGIINGDFNKESLMKIANVSNSDANTFLEEMAKRMPNKKKWEDALGLFKAGQKIAEWMNNQGFINLKVAWIGNESIGSVEKASKDLEIINANWRISIKENSNILINGSPERVFIKIPLAEFDRVRGQDWFLYTATNELQDYYLACDGKNFTGCETVEEYYGMTKSTTKRKSFGQHVKILHDTENKLVLATYKAFCQKVSIKSAELFNGKILELKNSKNYRKKFELIFHEFFRVNAVRYILAGIDKGEPFAIILNPSSEWSKSYEFLDIQALPKDAGQPEVLLRFLFKDKISNDQFEIDIKVEIRWSHGKFCGNPESKLYKPWRYKDLRWSNEIIL
ncbi:MAG: hypothetical protein HQM12_09410 [SAR324 cluster bacterium]|nr:hypothetical protein [SAR324 cluster bacterium]MBF0351333.1 hypothetical protein [SAR324 cluster bacterium]